VWVIKSQSWVSIPSTETSSHITNSSLTTVLSTEKPKNSSILFHLLKTKNKKKRTETKTIQKVLDDQCLWENFEGTSFDVKCFFSIIKKK